jgi:hypothetical protein
MLFSAIPSRRTISVANGHKQITKKDQGDKSMKRISLFFAVVIAVSAQETTFTMLADEASPAMPSGKSLTRQKVNQVGRGRYTAADDFRVDSSVTFSQPDYKFESRLPEGFGRATAFELGVSGQKFWNEYPGIGGALVVMNPNTVLIYDTVNRIPMYVTGCIREGKKGMNRIKPDTPPVAEVPPTGNLLIAKVQLSIAGGELRGADGQLLPTDEVKFDILGRTYVMDHTGKLLIEGLPAGTITIKEMYDHMKWRNISSTPDYATVEILPGQTVSVEFKNQNIIGSAPPPQTACKCEITSGISGPMLTAEGTCEGATNAELEFVSASRTFPTTYSNQMSWSTAQITSGLKSDTYDVTLKIKKGEEILATCPARFDHFAPTVSTPVPPLQLFTEVKYEFEKSGRRPWPFFLPILNCAWAYTHWHDQHAAQIIEKAAICPAEGVAAYIFWPVAALIKPAVSGAWSGIVF